jgi:hypothetical protein
VQARRFPGATADAPPPPELPGDELPFVGMITHYIDRAPIFRKAIEPVF